MTKKNLIVVLAVSTLLASGASMAQTANGTVTATGSFNAATCNVSIPSSTVSFGSLTNAELDAAKAFASLKKLSATPIVVNNCSTGASLTVTTTTAQENGYFYPTVGGKAQRDFALWLDIGKQGIKNNTPMQLVNGSYPIDFDLVKITNTKDSKYTGNWNAQYTLVATYN